MDIAGRPAQPLGPVLPAAAKGAAGKGEAAPDAKADAALHAAARALEANFLSLMLKSAGLDDVPGFGGGGEGEEQFASLLRDEQARLMVSAGGIGLSEQLFQALKKGQSHA